MTHWIIPWNKTHYDLDQALVEFEFVDWHQWNNYEIGDIAYIYCTLPTGRLCYKLQVEKVHLSSAEIVDDSRFYTSKNRWTLEPPKGYVRLRLINLIDIENDALAYSSLVANGMPKSVRTPIKVNARLLNHIIENIR